MQAAKVLVIDDEIQIRRLLKVGLESQGYAFLEASTGEEGLTMAANYKPELIILDLGLPGLRGIEILKQIRTWSETPIIILSVEDDEGAKVDALDSGANDYLSKPFSMAELGARIRANLRKHIEEGSHFIYKRGGLEVDLSKRLVLKDGKEVHLTVTEYHLLSFLIKYAGKVVTHRQILKEVWRENQEENVQYLRIFVGSLRKKIEADPANPTLIVTEPGVGYRLTES